MKEIVLTQGKVALVDDEDFESLNKYKWHAHKDKNTFYVRRKSNGKGILMHWYLIGKQAGLFMHDHINGNGLDNQKHNLRIVSVRDNQCNQRKRKLSKSSRYPGVCRERNSKKFRAYIYCDGKRIHLGCFGSEEAAFNSYAEARLRIGDPISIDI